MNLKFRLWAVLFSVMVVAGFSQISTAAEVAFDAKVVRVLINADDTFGGCMLALSVSPATVLPTCGEGWVTLDCSGQFTDNVRAYRMLDQGQLALATNRTVMVNVTDQLQHNGFCFANRIDILQ